METIAQACAVLEDLAPEWIGVCLDACHLAVQFETAQEATTLTQDAGVPIVKAQISSALRVEPHEHALLDRYTEPKFLHQVRERVNGHVAGVDDLPQAGELPGEREWRVHFHVPVHTATNTTQDELVDTLRALVGGHTPLTRHLEVETYTWSVMADDDETLIEGLASELEWTRDQIVALGAEVLA